MSNRVMTMMKIEAEERFTGVGELEIDDRKWQMNVEIDKIKGKIDEEIVHDFYFLPDQWPNIVWQESPKCLHHHQ